MERTLQWIDFLPLAAFAWGANFIHFNQHSYWENAFYIGALASLALLAYKKYRNSPLDFLAIGTYAFLIFGAFAYATHPILLAPYAWFKQSIIFVWVLLAGIIATLTTPEGFIQGSASVQQHSLLGSLALLALTASALILSYCLVTLTSADTAIGVVLPFLGLLLGRLLIRNYLEAMVKTN